MEFVSLYKIAAMSSNGGKVGRQHRLDADEIMMSTTKGGKNKEGVDRIALSFRISKQLMQKSRYIFGDRLDVLISTDGTTGLIKRVKEGGFAASSSGSKGSCMYLKVTWYEGMPKPTEKTYFPAEMTDDGIQFKIK